MSSDATSYVKPTLIQSLGMKPSFLWTAHHSISLSLFSTPFLCLGLTLQYMCLFFFHQNVSPSFEEPLS